LQLAVANLAAERLALRVMQFGAIAVVLVVSTLTPFELDRFFVPKELVLHLTAVIAGLLAFRAICQLPLTRIDLLLAAYLVLSALSAALATNRWLALRALTLSASAILIFWIARTLRDSLINGLVLAVVLAAITSLLQTYGVDTILFSESRAPGGTLGNRNFVAHVAAFGLPICLFVALRAKRYVIASIGVAIVVASLVLTRSRAAWLAFAVVVLIFFVSMFRGDARAWRRLFGIVAMSCGAVAAALIIPNSLRWRSRNPYLESVQHVAEYQEGSGRGRLIQYERSLLLAARHPLFGVGPGNWAVAYPARVPASDPSLSDSEAGMTFNPWPSSDWIAFVSERGLLAAICIALALIGLALSGLREPALFATIAAAVVAGLFDAVLLLPVPAFLFWAAEGAISAAESPSPRLRGEGAAERRMRGDPHPALRATLSRTAGEGHSREVRWFVVLPVIVLVAIGVARSTAQLVAMDMYTTGSSLTRAATIDPGNYRVQLHLARSGKHRCEHARAAHDLYPSARAAAEIARGCY